MSKARTTADIARELLAGAGERNLRGSKPAPTAANKIDALLASANATLRSVREPWYFEEASALVGDDAEDRANKTRAAAAAEIGARDSRPMVGTKYGNVRREFDDYGSATRRAAREAIDLHAALNGHELSEQDQQAGALNQFAREVNDSTWENTLLESHAAPGSDAWSSNADSIGDAMVSRSREAQ